MEKIWDGLKYHDTFGYLAGLSCAMIVDGLTERTNEIPFFIESRDYAGAIFGELDRSLILNIRKIEERRGYIYGKYKSCIISPG